MERHAHGDKNSLGLHEHHDPDDYEKSMGGGEHDHALDPWGIHFHKNSSGETFVGGTHHHGLSLDDDASSTHDHQRMGASGRDGMMMEMETTKSQGLMVVSLGHHRHVAGDEAEAIVVAKSLETDYQDALGWIVCFSKGEYRGARFYPAENREVLMSKFPHIREEAKSLAKVTGFAEMAEVTGRCGKGVYIAKRHESFFVSNPIDLNVGDEVVKAKKESDLPDSDFALIRTVDGEKKRSLRIDDMAHAKNALARMNQLKPPLSESEKDSVAKKIKKRYPFISVSRVEKSVPLLHSVVVSKPAFDSHEAMLKWAAHAGFRTEKAVDLGDSLVFIQGDSSRGTPEFLTRELTKGVTANFEKADGFEVFATFRKGSADEEERTVEGLVYEPYVEDSQNDWAAPEDIREAAHDFLANGFTKNVDREHNFQNTGCAVVESFIAKANDPHYREGSWVVKVKVYVDSLWEDIKKGEINGFSMAGAGVRVYEDSPPATGAFAFSKALDAFGASKPRTRLTKLRVSYISLVRAGANCTEFKFRKSEEDQTDLFWKSRDRQIFDGDVKFSNDRNLLQVIGGFFKNWLGSQAPSIDSATNAPATSMAGGKADMKNLDPKLAGIFSLLTGIAGRQAQTERVIKTLFSNENFAAFAKSQPELVEILSKLDPKDLEHFAKQGEFLAQGANNNGVTLPSVPTNFFGFAAANIDMSSYVTRAESAAGGNMFSGGLMASGQPSGGADSGLAKRMEDLETQLKAMAEKSAPPINPADLVSFGKSLDELKAQVSAIQKATAPVPATTPAPVPAPVVPAVAPAAPVDADPILKAKDPENNPYGTDPIAIFGGIGNSGKNNWLK